MEKTGKRGRGGAEARRKKNTQLLVTLGERSSNLKGHDRHVFPFH
jgi:hypothetical protein